MNPDPNPNPNPNRNPNRKPKPNFEPNPNPNPILRSSRVTLPSSLLGNISLDLQSEVFLVFYVSALNPHGLAAARRRRRLASSGLTLQAASPMASFALRQNGREVVVANLSAPVQLDLSLAEGRITNGTP